MSGKQYRIVDAEQKVKLWWTLEEVLPESEYVDQPDWIPLLE